ncbi:MAG: aldolase/citrate lyase family protein [Bacteroidales bacterium]|jgi:4-hydroxy-2-oxoheptanedioate aldolase
MKKEDWLNKNKFLFGPFIRIPRPEIIEMIGIAGFDFAIVDIEHGGMISHNEIYPLILAAENRNIKLIVRTPGLQENYIKWLLDMGIHGLQIPHIKSSSDAELAVKFSKFSPDGERGLCRFVRAAEFSNISKEDYLKETNNKSLIILQIEGKEGADNIEEIVKVKGVDIIFIGPYDLSQSLGIPGQIWHEKVIKEIKKIIDACNKQNISTGIFTDTLEGIEKWSKFGVKYLNYKVDVEMILSCFKTQLNELKNIVKDK